MEGRILDELILEVVAICLIGGIILSWIGWKVIRWSVGKLYFLWRSRKAGVLLQDENGIIEEVRWGCFRISGKEFQKDIRCVVHEPSLWTDRRGHVLDEEMITGVWEKDIEVLVIGLGIDGALQCPLDLQDRLRKRGIREIVAKPTVEACRIFNSYIKSGRRAALLAHGTC
ncbi:MAG TPA: MTH938/NDUFAF3 family protein [Candidatus Ozemobacteraceae bacterium]|nr:MTH938/NDUFAF3 family protein [Candidatus Ozemobacteraceae bacterium]HQG28117.1 MTH938/NDUFAF3 family protein [Candidatus Ozemobacteraceae bacterium]